MRLTLTADTRGMDATFAHVERAFADMSRGPMARGFEQAGNMYLANMRERFQGEGNGEWKPLAKATREQRQYLGFSPASPKLRRLGHLYRGLIQGLSGNLFDSLTDGVRVGIGGGFIHPGYAAPSGKRVGGNVRLGKIAQYHQGGTSKMDARTILVRPDGNTQARMRAALQAAVQETVGIIAKDLRGRN